MTYNLVLGDYAYSSWSLRAWLLFDRFGIPFKHRMISFQDGPVPDQIPDMAPAKTVPVMRTPDGAVVGDSMAIAEELANRHPEVGFWPSDPRKRAIARALAAEMHSGFSTLRTLCPMSLRNAYIGMEPNAELDADLRRLEVIWENAWSECPSDSPWLCGEYSVADAFYAPVAARIAGYDLTVSPSAQAYVDAHLEDLSFRRWRAMGLVHGPELKRYAQPYETQNWKGPPTRIGHAISSGDPENDACFYSGGSPNYLMEFDGRTFGFCNAFCRDKTAADPGAWPAFVSYLSEPQMMRR